ncbi:hypothetical protein TNCV_2654101 [Trichonephila clavipes]|nr:hypothetical protein TNCV_2654101 [Trichonephila clavipes]
MVARNEYIDICDCVTNDATCSEGSPDERIYDVAFRAGNGELPREEMVTLIKITPRCLAHAMGPSERSGGLPGPVFVSCFHRVDTIFLSIPRALQQAAWDQPALLCALQLSALLWHDVPQVPKRAPGLLLRMSMEN